MPAVAVVDSILGDIEKVTNGKMMERSLEIQRIPLYRNNWQVVTMETCLANILPVMLRLKLEMVKRTSVVKMLPWALQSPEL